MVAGGAAPTGPVPRIPEPMLLLLNKRVYQRRKEAYRVNVVTKQIEVMKATKYYQLH